MHYSQFGHHNTRPHIQWFHHSQPIQPDDQHYRIIEGPDTSTLEIIRITRADTGQVWCVAQTASGSATTTCDINVSGITKIKDRNFLRCERLSCK